MAVAYADASPDGLRTGVRYLPTCRKHKIDVQMAFLAAVRPAGFNFAMLTPGKQVEQFRAEGPQASNDSWDTESDSG
jgi:hypothetical protein